MMLQGTKGISRFAQWAYVQACFRSLDKATAAIKRDPDNPERYHARAYIYLLMHDFVNARKDVEHTQKLGGRVHPILLDALGLGTNTADKTSPVGTMR